MNRILLFNRVRRVAVQVPHAQIGVHGNATRVREVGSRKLSQCDFEGSWLGVGRAVAGGGRPEEGWTGVVYFFEQQINFQREKTRARFFKQG